MCVGKKKQELAPSSEVLPTSQDVHDDALEDEYVPAEQMVQACSSRKKPA